MPNIKCELCGATWGVVNRFAQDDAIRHVVQRHEKSRDEAAQYLTTSPA